MVEYWVNHIDEYHKCIILKDEEENVESTRSENKVHRGEHNSVKKSYIEHWWLKRLKRLEQGRGECSVL